MKKSYQHNFTKMAKGKRPGCRVSIKARMKTSMGNFDGWNIRIDGDLDKKFYRNQALVPVTVMLRVPLSVAGVPSSSVTV